MSNRIGILAKELKAGTEYRLFDDYRATIWTFDYFSGIRAYGHTIVNDQMRYNSVQVDELVWIDGGQQC